MCSSRGAARFGLGVGDVIAAWRIYGINRRRACPRAELCNSDVIVSEMPTSNYLYRLQGGCKEHGEGGPASSWTGEMLHIRSFFAEFAPSASILGRGRHR